MPRARAFSSTPVACSSLYMRKRLPQPMARMETDAPVRPSVRWGMVPGAAWAARPDETRAAALAASALLSRNSRRDTLSRFRISVSCRSKSGGALTRDYDGSSHCGHHRDRWLRPPLKPPRAAPPCGRRCALGRLALSGLNARRGQILRHHLRVVREGDL